MSTPLRRLRGEGEDIDYFALQIGAPDYGRACSERIPITRRLLTSLGILN